MQVYIFTIVYYFHVVLTFNTDHCCREDERRIPQYINYNPCLLVGPTEIQTIQMLHLWCLRYCETRNEKGWI